MLECPSCLATVSSSPPPETMWLATVCRSVWMTARSCPVSSRSIPASLLYRRHGRLMSFRGLDGFAGLGKSSGPFRGMRLSSSTVTGSRWRTTFSEVLVLTAGMVQIGSPLSSPSDSDYFAPRTSLFRAPVKARSMIA